ncbi:MAG TPA: ribonuclease E/G [Geminicoccaceae bacterium]|nr:ribonuclease E/G [Geminicoccaceae bacterium]
MSRELVIETTPFGARAALLEDGRLVDVGIVDDDAVPIRGQIFLGRVRAVDHDLDSAFVDCGLGEHGYLSARDARALSGRARDAPIGRQLHEGQAVLVQGRREPQSGKGPRLTGDVALAGPCLIFRPRQAGGALSERRAARGATAAELSDEAGRLRRLWQAIEAKARDARPPARLHGPGEPVRQLLVEHLGDDPDRIVVAEQRTLLGARGYLAEWRPSLLDRLEHLPDAFAASGAEEQLAAALEPVVDLAGGGRLILQSTAALTAIDVDGGGRRPLDADLEAAAEIARQLRLRRLGGTIVVDFVDLAAKSDRARLLATLRAALAADPAPVQVGPMSLLGLVELSRKRNGPPLAERIGRSCPCCGGTGLLPGLRRRSEELMRDLAGRPPGRVSAVVAPDLHAYLSGAAATVWKTFGERQGRTPAMQVDAALGPGDYRIEEAGA